MVRGSTFVHRHVGFKRLRLNLVRRNAQVHGLRPPGLDLSLQGLTQVNAQVNTHVNTQTNTQVNSPVNTQDYSSLY